MPRFPLPLKTLMFAAVAAASPVTLPADVAPAAETWTNPIVRQRADPWVWREPDGTYYFIATVPEYDRIELRKASSIGELGAAEAVVVWRKPASGPASHHIWAPELHRIGGKWYIYFAGGRADDIWNIRMYALECADTDPLSGKWTGPVRVFSHLDTFSLDATSFEHKGVRYMAWAQHDPAIGGNTSLFIAKMDTPLSITGKPVRITIPEFPWEIRGFKVNEGPAVLHRNGRLFLTYSASATDANYCMGLLTADEDADLLDAASWKKSPEPVFVSSDQHKVFGPGHNSFTVLPDGRDVLIYHARDYRDIKGDPLSDPNRHTRASLIRWTESGEPRFEYGP